MDDLLQSLRLRKSFSYIMDCIVSILLGTSFGTQLARPFKQIFQLKVQKGLNRA